MVAHYLHNNFLRIFFYLRKKGPLLKRAKKKSEGPNSVFDELTDYHSSVFYPCLMQVSSACDYSKAFCCTCNNAKKLYLSVEQFCLYWSKHQALLWWMAQGHLSPLRGQI